MQTHRLWLAYAVITMLAWGLWGAIINHPLENGFPETLGYFAWSLSMIPPAAIAMWMVGWKLEGDGKSLALGLAAGLLGAGGQLLLFQTVPGMAPGYLVFPFIALSPLVTIVMAAAISRERVRLLGWIGVVLAIVAGVLLNLQDADMDAQRKAGWIMFAAGVLLAWGIQGYVISLANNTMKAESIFFYMAITALALAPVAWWMTDEPLAANWGASGFWLSMAIGFLNSIGALLLVYAYRYGKAIIVSPLINAGAPVITALLSMVLASNWPSTPAAVGIVLAIVAAILMTIEEEEEAENQQQPAAESV